MSPIPSRKFEIPHGFLYVASVFIVLHLGAIGIHVLSAPSGPWPTQEGERPFDPPRFAYEMTDYVFPYLKAIKMSHDYHFPSNQPFKHSARFTVRLKDESGKEIATLDFPDKDANRWIRHRQQILASRLIPDEPVPMPQGEVIPPPGQEVTFEIWQPANQTDPSTLVLKKEHQHLLPRDRPSLKPSAWSMLLVNAYARHLCRKHGAAKAEFIRHFQLPYPPQVLLFENVQPEVFAEYHSNYGELPR